MVLPERIAASLQSFAKEFLRLCVLAFVAVQIRQVVHDDDRGKVPLARNAPPNPQGALAKLPGFRILSLRDIDQGHIVHALQRLGCSSPKIRRRAARVARYNGSA